MNTRRRSQGPSLAPGALILATTLALTACSKDTESLVDSGALDAGSADAAASIDAAIADAEPNPDAAADAGASVDAGSVRRLVERKLFGDMPIENRVHNPQFDGTTFSWYAFSDSGRFISTRTEHRAASPTREPLLRVSPDRRGGGSVVLLGTAKGSPTALEISLWTGAVNAGDGPMVALAGVSPSTGDWVLELSPTADPPAVLDGITWTRWAGRIDEPTVGWLDVLVTHASAEPVYLTGVWITPAAIGRARGPVEKLPEVRRRAATQLEARARAAVAAEQKKRLGAPPKPQTAPLRPLLIR
jgi:hypothetical protein